MKKILVLGGSGMLGHKIFEVLSKYPQFDTFATVITYRSFDNTLPIKLKKKVIENVFADDIDSVYVVLKKLKPYVVINCIGVIKQNEESKNTINIITLNSLFPQQISKYCKEKGIRFITIATDCVFDGKGNGGYLESDLPTCHDIYGMSKYLGEIKDSKSTLTLRTSIIGHELKSNLSLVDWFLSQNNETVKGYKNAIFSGFPTCVFARLLAEKIIPNETLTGLYHISADPISKYELLKKIAKEYEKKVEITADLSVKINRSLNSSLLRSIIRYKAPIWDNLIVEMRNDFLTSEFYSEKKKQYEKNDYFQK